MPDNKPPRRPAELTDPAAKRFWDRHVDRLWEDATLTARDVESFTALCQVWGRLQKLANHDPADYRLGVQFNNLLKQYEKYARSFGLIGPKGRPQPRAKTITDRLNELMGD
jgi:hypothetical protein